MSKDESFGQAQLIAAVLRDSRAEKERSREGP
jgi:hypothetical protein